MPCEERDRLLAIYLAALVENAVAGRTIGNVRSEAWREATKETRRARDEALNALNRHTAEHGCNIPSNVE
jgi:hypothetical protein